MVCVYVIDPKGIYTCIHFVYSWFWVSFVHDHWTSFTDTNEYRKYSSNNIDINPVVPYLFAINPVRDAKLVWQTNWSTVSCNIFRPIDDAKLGLIMFGYTSDPILLNGHNMTDILKYVRLGWDSLWHFSKTMTIQKRQQHCSYNLLCSFWCAFVVILWYENLTNHLG